MPSSFLPPMHRAPSDDLATRPLPGDYIGGDPGRWGELRADRPFVVKLPSGSEGGQSIPNKEELPAWTRIVAGGFPMIALFGFLYVVLVWAALFGGAESAPIVALLVIWTGIGVIAAVWIAIRLRRRTPTHIRFGADSISAEWGSPPHLTEQIPYSKITGFAKRRWKWISEGKANFYRFTPSLVQYTVAREGGGDEWTRYGKNQQVLFLTDANLDRAHAAYEAWGGPERARSGSPLPAGA